MPANRPVTHRPLTRERVLAAAVHLADAEGLPAVTMRRLASELGVEAMSLYHHLPGKEALLDGLLETVVDQVLEAVDEGGDIAGEAGGDWRAEVRRRCLAARTVMLRHPWAPGLISTRPTVPFTAYAHFEAILEVMVRGGLSYRLGHRAMHSLGGMALGFVAEIFSPDPTGGGLDPDRAQAEFAEMAQRVPTLAAMVEAEMHVATDPTLGWCDSQTEFEFTLDLILDGLEAHRAGTA